MIISYTAPNGAELEATVVNATKFAKRITPLPRLTEVRDLRATVDDIVADLLELKPDGVLFVGVDEDKAKSVISAYRAHREVVTIFVN